MPAMSDATPQPWSISDAADLYGIEAWGHVQISPEGHLLVRPDRAQDRTIDLLEVVEGLRERSLTAPVLLRFRDVLADRVRSLYRAFEQGIADAGFRGSYMCVYPIKVNQQRQVVEELLAEGSTYGFGLEAGSKPELLAALGVTARTDTPIVCNGFKDSEFIEMVVLAAKLGRQIIPIVEKFSELELIVKHALRYGVRPTIGVRVKLSAHGAGRWHDSGGLRSKFGLYVSEVLRAFEHLEERGMAECLQLLHCHIGSQVSDIRRVKVAINELAHIYAELSRLGAGMRYLDLGGGLGVDYDGSQSKSDSSVNYTLEEYAADVVYRITNVCDDAEVPHPTIITESGRALTAYHSVMVFDVVGTTSFDALEVPPTIEEAAGENDPNDLPQPLWDLYEAYHALGSGGRVEETYHDAVQAHEEAMNLFNLGYMPLGWRALAEQLYWVICAHVLRASRQMEEIPEELEALAEQMSDICFVNLSIFQSLPDAWAIDQLFPVVPIQRLNEAPDREAILADITCDSEGKLDRFVGSSTGPQGTLPVHRLRDGERYYLAAFLVGAYQEILGDLHNLFGDTHVVHLGFDEEGRWAIEEVVQGDTVREVLSYVQYDTRHLHERLRSAVEVAMRSQHLTVAEGRQLLAFYRSGLTGYTYLEEEGSEGGE
jgi:arginine decarboxylase